MATNFNVGVRDSVSPPFQTEKNFSQTTNETRDTSSCQVKTTVFKPSVPWKGRRSKKLRCTYVPPLKMCPMRELGMGMDVNEKTQPERIEILVILAVRQW